jgi:hypothetical protein
MQFIDWVYEADYYHKKATANIKQEYKDQLKHWFTTI